MLTNYLKYFLAFIVIVGIIYAGLVGLEAATPELFVALSAAVIAMAFERFPWLAEEFNKLTDSQKQWAMRILLLILVGGAFGLSCASLVVLFTCDGAGIQDAVLTFLFAIAINQGTFALVHDKSLPSNAAAGKK